MKKSKLLCVLHYSPPVHGASKVGDFIKDSQLISDEFDCYYIKIKSSETIDEIGKMSPKKIYLVIELFLKVLWALVVFRPNLIYFTASSKGFAFYRDVVISLLWKVYQKFKKVEIFYHYHTKGINNFVSESDFKLKLTRFFLNKINLILLSPMLEKDFQLVNSYKKVFYLPNGVEDPMRKELFSQMIQDKYGSNRESTNILYLSNMIKSKGYFNVLELAKETSSRGDIEYHFAGGWQSTEDEKEFFNYMDQNKLQESVTFHGFVNGEEKKKLFQNADIFIFPTRYENEAFPLSILESFSYGVPVIVTDEGSIPYIVNERSGLILDREMNLLKALEEVEKTLINKETAYYCRKRYQEHFSLTQFEKNFVHIFQEGA